MPAATPSSAHAAVLALSGQERHQRRHPPGPRPGLWVSSQQERLPQYIEFELPQETEIDTVYLTFDTNLDKIVPFGPAPECVRDYRLSYYDGQRWRDLFDERGNHQRRRRHEFAAIRTAALRLTVLATNGRPRLASTRCAPTSSGPHRPRRLRRPPQRWSRRLTRPRSNRSS